MKMRLLTLIAVPLLTLNAVPEAAVQQKAGAHVIADFEGEKPVAANKATHTAKITAVKDVPEGGGRFAAKTVVDVAVKAGAYFGTGFGIPAMDLSGASEIKFWIKTDIESGFNNGSNIEGECHWIERFGNVAVGTDLFRATLIKLIRFT